MSGAYRYVVVAHGHAAAGDDGALPRRMRPVVTALTAVMDHHAF